MPRCMCMTKAFKQCLNQASKKSNSDHKFCWQHQNCQVTYPVAKSLAPKGSTDLMKALDDLAHHGEPGKIYLIEYGSMGSMWIVKRDDVDSEPEYHFSHDEQYLSPPYKESINFITGYKNVGKIIPSWESEPQSEINRYLMKALDELAKHDEPGKIYLIRDGWIVKRDDVDSEPESDLLITVYPYKKSQDFTTGYEKVGKITPPWDYDTDDESSWTSEDVDKNEGLIYDTDIYP